MSTFQVHTLETAPAASRPILEKLKANVGAIPNLAGIMAESPTLIEAFVTLRGIWQTSSFSAVERELVAATNAVTNQCQYCVAIHSAFALKEGLVQEELDLIRAGSLPQEPRLKALATFAQRLMSKRGQVSDADLKDFLSAGFSQVQALEVIVGAGVSVLANFTDHIAHTPLDEFLKPQAWAATA